jgi:hypothetical protein
MIFSDETSVVLEGVRGKRRMWRNKCETYYPHVVIIDRRVRRSSCDGAVSHGIIRAPTISGKRRLLLRGRLCKLIWNAIMTHDTRRTRPSGSLNMR